MGADFEVLEKPMEGTNEIRVEFSPSTEMMSGRSSGHYIINTTDNAILSFNSKTIQPLPESIGNNAEYSHTLELQRTIFFEKDPTSKRYFMNYAKQMAIVASKTEDQNEPTTFEIEIILHTTNPFSALDVKSNVNEQKDVFKLKSSYNADFWKFQNQLLLTDEMLEFLTKLTDENTEFKFRSNLE